LLARYVTCVHERQVQQLDHVRVGQDERATPLSLSLPLGRSAYTGPAVANYFDNLLPDNEQIRRRIQARFDTDSTRPFDLLSAIGTDATTPGTGRSGPHQRRISSSFRSARSVVST
jgi:HipA-like protein